ncbi:MAG: transketolase [Spartobacteria bacterium]|nr:transketolase [Spartobacteria bacterium]
MGDGIMVNFIDRLQAKSYEVRTRVLETCIKAGTGHVTSCMSCTEILVALYYGGLLRFDPEDETWQERDRFFLSKGQASPLLYTILADCGFYDVSQLEMFAQDNGMFGVHLQKSVPGVEITCGSLGQGFGMAAGVALAAKMNRENYLIYSLLGDGECYEGAIWETAMFASHNRLNNLVAIIDRNGLCVTDFTENIVALEPLDERWESFGWDVIRVNGHSLEELMLALGDARSRRSTRPLCVIADTVKGQGIDSLSNIPLWHGLAPKGTDAEKARQELKRRYENG